MKPASKASPAPVPPLYTTAWALRAEALAARDRHAPVGAARNHHSAGPSSGETFGLLHWIIEAGQHGRFIPIGKKHVRLGQHAFESTQVIARAGQDNI